MSGTDFQEHNALRNRIYVGGKVFSRDPVPVTVSIERFEAKTRTANLSLRVDRAFILTGQPNILDRHEILLPWRDLRESDMLEHIGLLAAVGQPFDVGVFKQMYDVFDGDEVTTDFFLQRRIMLSQPQVLPFVPVIFPDWPIRILRFNIPMLDPAAVSTELAITYKLSVDMDTGTPGPDEVFVEQDGHQLGDLWLTRIRLGSAPCADHDVLVAIYLPLYRMVVDQDLPRSYGEALVEPRGLKLVEIG